MSDEHKTCYYLTITLDDTEEVFITNIIICILNSVFSLITFAANLVILHAIRKDEDLHSPPFIPLCCLAFSNLLVGLVCQPFLVAYKISELVDNFPAHCRLRMIYDLSGYITSGASLLTLTAVSIDRLLAVILHLRYRNIVTVPRVFQTAVFFLGVHDDSCCAKVLDYVHCLDVSPLDHFAFNTFCNNFQHLQIFRVVRRHQRQIIDQYMAALNLQTNTVNVLKCKKSAVTVLYIFGLFLLLYLHSA